MTSGFSDVIFQNGKFSTPEPSRTHASAVAARAGKFLAVGSNSEVQRFRGDHTQLVDLRGRSVVPGLNDSRLHLIRGGLNFNLELRWDGVPSLADAP